MDNILHWFWADGFRYILYVMLAISTIYTTTLIIKSPLKEKMSQLHYKSRLRKVRLTQQHKKQITIKNPILKHIYLLIKTTSKESSEQDVISFVTVTSLAFLFTFVMVFLQFNDIVLASVLGMLVALLPYLFLQLRLRKLRFILGNEFLNIVRDLTQNYSANHYDMYHALVETQKHIQNNDLRKIIIKLISDLQIAKNEEELRMAVQVFVFTSGTNSAKRLGNTIIKAYVYHENVLNTLMVLTKQIEETEEMLEQEKSSTLDHVFDGYLTIPVFLVALVLGYFISGAQDWFNLQFEHTWTLLLFIISIIGVVFSVIISLLLKRPKNDI